MSNDFLGGFSHLVIDSHRNQGLKTALKFAPFFKHFLALRGEMGHGETPGPAGEV